MASRCSPSWLYPYLSVPTRAPAWAQPGTCSPNGRSFGTSDHGCLSTPDHDTGMTDGVSSSAYVENPLIIRYSIDCTTTTTGNPLLGERFSGRGNFILVKSDAFLFYYVHISRYVLCEVVSRDASRRCLCPLPTVNSKSSDGRAPPSARENHRSSTSSPRPRLRSLTWLVQ